MTLVSAVGLVGLVVLFAPSPRAQKVKSHDYVGADACRTCHQPAYDAWQKGPHANTLASLSEKDRNDTRCRTCHTMVASDPQQKFDGVQCETCHGPGRYYRRAYVMRDPVLRKELFMETPTAETCTRCHTENAPNLTAFDYESALQRIRHWPEQKAPSDSAPAPAGQK